MTADKHRFFSGWTIICGFLFLGMLPGCSVSRTANPSDINLVSPESPIFDKRFESASLRENTSGSACVLGKVAVFSHLGENYPHFLTGTFTNLQNKSYFL